MEEFFKLNKPLDKFELKFKKNVKELTDNIKNSKNGTQIAQNQILFHNYNVKMLSKLNYDRWKKYILHIYNGCLLFEQCFRDDTYTYNSLNPDLFKELKNSIKQLKETTISVKK